MSTLQKLDALRRFSQEDSGQDLLEYALLASLIAIAVIGAVDTIGGTIKTIFWDAIANAKF
jgi:Flp pilus assembly pilin Flp